MILYDNFLICLALTQARSLSPKILLFYKWIWSGFVQIYFISNIFYIAYIVDVSIIFSSMWPVIKWNQYFYILINTLSPTSNLSFDVHSLSYVSRKENS